VGITRLDQSNDTRYAYSANYSIVEVGLKYQKTIVTLGNEQLEGNNVTGESFVTPLASLHKYNGWADKFLGTPTGGIDDVYLSVKHGFNEKTKFAIAFHDFEAESSGGDYGSEWDMSLSHKFNANFSLLFKLADYESDGLSVDTTKV
jgi:hypothetical protein|tara:strand:+ start:166 stop:606 length:441 start_codon:yes stop_codon:yes gene_type:complete